jgi:hypothetical protein
MKTRAKIAIFLVAVMISLIGFSLIASPSALSLFELGKNNVCHYDVVVTAKIGSSARPVVQINGLP